jgi:hypothetical protein
MLGSPTPVRIYFKLLFKNLFSIFGLISPCLPVQKIKHYVSTIPPFSSFIAICGGILAVPSLCNSFSRALFSLPIKPLHETRRKIELIFFPFYLNQGDQAEAFCFFFFYRLTFYFRFA